MRTHNQISQAVAVHIPCTADRQTTFIRGGLPVDDKTINAGSDGRQIDHRCGRIDRDGVGAGTR